MPHVVFSRRGEEYLRVELGREVTIGRRKPSDSMLTERDILPVAARITFTGGVYRLTRWKRNPDYGRVDQTDEGVLRDGAEIAFGETTAVFLENATDGGGLDVGGHTVRDGIDAPKPLPAELWLMAQEIDGVGAPKQVALGAELVVGSGPDSGLKLQGSLVSARHARVSRQDGRLVLHDLQSTNGTRLNGVRVYACELPLGVRFRVGHFDIWAIGAAKKVDSDVLNFEGIVTADPAMKGLCARIERIAPGDLPVLIQGASGTGKELVARALHERSNRAAAPFSSVNCAAIPDHLIEAELFGHAKGAYTGAIEATKGAFGKADGGTVFLDELGELDQQQPALLRVTESGEYKPVGADAIQKGNFRIVAATNRDMVAEVAAFRFREDLFYRLAIEQLFIPPLSQRKGDILHLWDHWIRRFRPAGAPIPERGRAVDSCLINHPWHGNIRELKTVIHRALSNKPPDSPTIEVAHLSFDKTSSRPTPTGHLIDPVGRTLHENEQTVIKLTLKHCNGNRSQAARLLGIERSTLRYKLGEMGFTVERASPEELANAEKEGE